MKSLILAVFVIFSLSVQAETYKELQSKAFSNQAEMSVRWKALMDIVRMKKHDSIRDLKKALSSKVWYMRNAGLIALDSLNADMAFDVAKKQLHDPALVVRSAAVDILIKNKKRQGEVREILWRELASGKNKVKSKSLWIRPQIGEYLAQNPLPSEREKFLSLADEKDQDVRVQAEKALKKLESQSF